MPLYEYKCDACGHRFEVIHQRFSDPPATTCPVCGGAVHKLFSSPAIQFKGSGFYITDYAKKDQPSTETDGDSKDSSGSQDAAEKAATSDKSDTSDKTEKAVKADKSEKSEKSDKSDKSEKKSEKQSSSSDSASTSTAPAKADSSSKKP